MKARPQANPRTKPRAGRPATAAARPRQSALAAVASAGTDFYLVDELLTARERAVRDRVRRFSDEQVIPVINRYWEAAEFPFELIPRIAELGIAGGTVKGHGCAGLSPVAAGLVAMELARGDGSVSTFYGVHSGLAMGSIAMLGSAEQKRRWLPQMARFEKIGAFALTEPDHGSDSLLLETTARRDGDSWVLDGRKKWIGNGSFADLIVVWARDPDGNVGGFVVERPVRGLKSEVITGKISKRAVWQAELELRGVRVPLANRLARSNSFKDTGKVLTATRYGVAWESLGHAVACYEAALEYAQQRTQFGKPLAGFQMVQGKLARMLTEVTAMQLICWRLSVLALEGRITPGMASLAKMNNARKARWVAAQARDILGGNGILLENHVARHQADMEAVFTYEGTDSIQALIMGKEITGTQAFV